MGEFEQDRTDELPQKPPVVLVPGELDGQEPKKFDFEKYREVADELALGVRKVGLLDPELAYESLKDKRTITVATEFGDMPILTPIEYAAGFDVQRAKDMAKHNTQKDGEVYYFCMPPNFIKDETAKQDVVNKLRVLKDQQASIYFDYVETDPSSRVELLTLLQEAGLAHQEVPLRDERAGEGYEDVTINFYKIVMESTAEDTGGKHNSIQEAFDEACAKGEFEQFPQNGPMIIMGSEMSQDLVDQLWDVYQNRFEWLGENHPVSMEENKEEFELLLRNPNTVACIYFVKGEPVCWTYGVTDAKAEIWLQESFIEENVTEDETPFFFPGIVAKADDVGGYSEPTIKLVGEMMSRTNKRYAVMFESTNISEQYVPRLVQQYITETGQMAVEQAQRLDNTHYDLVSVG